MEIPLVADGALLGYDKRRSPSGQKGAPTMDRTDQWALQVWSSIEALREVVLFREVLDALREKAEDALELASYSSQPYTKTRIPVLPVVPRYLLRTGASRVFSENKIEDVDTSPQEPYFLVDVEVGGRMVGLDPRRALSAIRVLHRHPLTLEQALSLFYTEGRMCPERIFVLGSVDLSSPGIPLVLKVTDGEPPRDNNSEFGIPSFAAII